MIITAINCAKSTTTSREWPGLCERDLTLLPPRMSLVQDQQEALTGPEPLIKWTGKPPMLKLQPYKRKLQLSVRKGPGPQEKLVRCLQRRSKGG